MAFFRRWLLLLTALILGGGPVMAAASREERAFAAAAAEFHDGLYDRAGADFAQFRQRFPKSDRLADAILLQAQAQFKQGQIAEAEHLLAASRATAGALADRFDYWTGEAQFARGDFAAAANTFAALAKNFPQSPLGLSAVVERAAAAEKLGDWPAILTVLEATNGVFQRTEKLDPDNELVADGRFLLARAKAAVNDLAGAKTVLLKMNSQVLAPELEWRRLQQLYQNCRATGDLDAELAVTTNLIQVARLQKDAARLADGVAKHALGLEEKQLPAEARAAWAENLAGGAPAERQQEAVLKMATLAAAQGNLTDAAADLEKYLAQFPDAAAAELARLTLGELRLKDFSDTNQLAQAQAKFDQLLGAATNGPLAGRAFLGRGWCFWLAGKTNESLADFQSAAQRLPPSEALAVAKFKTGDAQFSLGDFAGAIHNYQSVLADFSAWPAVAKALGDRALYQLVRADLRRQDAAGAEAAMRMLLKQFPRSELAEDGLLLAGEGVSDFRSPVRAREIFQEFAAQFPASLLRPQVGLAVARTFEREQNWPAAITNYQDWQDSFPTNELRPQADYALAWATAQAGDETNAFTQFAAFVTQFPADPLAPLAQWWVADHFFRRNNFSGAETNYEAVFQNPAWQNSPLVYPAQLMAGRAAMGRLGFLDANNYLTKLLDDTNCPPALKTQARFAYGSVLMRLEPANTNQPLANFGVATNVFAAIYKENSTNELGALAATALGDGAVQFGDFDAATNAYAQAANSPFAGPGPRSLAQVKLGIALEKKAALLPPEARLPILQLALKNYQDVIYTPADTADAFWTKKAGLQALPLMIRLGADQKTLDDFFNRLETLLPPLRDTLEQKRAALGK